MVKISMLTHQLNVPHRSVDKELFGNSSTKIIGRLESAQHVDRVKEWFSKSGAAPSWLGDRKGAEQGTFVARWPAMPPELEGETLRSRMLFSQHQGAWSPDQVEQAMLDSPLRLSFLATKLQGSKAKSV